MSFVIDKDDLLSLPHEAGELYLPHQVPCLSVPPSPITFLREYVMPNLPVVIENGVKHWPALTKWTKDYLQKILGEKFVTVSITPNGYADAPIGDKFVLPDEEEMKFKDFILKLDRNCEDEIVYIQKQNSSFTDEFSELIKDAASNIPWASEAFGKLPDAVNFWMGSKRSVTSMHKDHYENMYAVVKGSKTFILHPPTDLPCISYRHYQVCRYKKDELGKYIIKEEINEEHCELCKNEFSQGFDIMKGFRSKESNIETKEICHDGNDVNNELETKMNDISLDNHSFVEKKDCLNEKNSFKENSNIPYSCNCECSCHNASIVPWVAVDPLNPDYDKYPLYKYAHQLKVTVNPGDLFYLPSTVGQEGALGNF